MWLAVHQAVVVTEAGNGEMVTGSVSTEDGHFSILGNLQGEYIVTFSFIGFEWLQPLPGNGMYYYFILMGIFGMLITLGYRYRFSAFAFAVMWSGVYLMQKTSYNNHYYLLMLLAFIMGFLPAHQNLSLDAHLNPKIKKDWMYNWVRWLIIGQLFIVYTYASIAKLYADWLDFSIIEILMKGKKDTWK